jgi:hypothetical protein
VGAGNGSVTGVGSAEAPAPPPAPALSEGTPPAPAEATGTPALPPAFADVPAVPPAPAAGDIPTGCWPVPPLGAPAPPGGTEPLGAPPAAEAPWNGWSDEGASSSPGAEHAANAEALSASAAKPGLKNDRGRGEFRRVLMVPPRCHVRALAAIASTYG